MGEGMKEAKDATLEKPQTLSGPETQSLLCQTTIFNPSQDPRWAWFLAPSRPQAFSL